MVELEPGIRDGITLVLDVLESLERRARREGLEDNPMVRGLIERAKETGNVSGETAELLAAAGLVAGVSAIIAGGEGEEGVRRWVEKNLRSAPVTGEWTGMVKRCSNLWDAGCYRMVRLLAGLAVDLYLLKGWDTGKVAEVLAANQLGTPSIDILRDE